MKKFILRVLVVFVVIVAAVIAACFVMMNSIVKKSVETIGPKVTGVEVKLAGVKVSPFSGKGEISGLMVGNPPGFKTPTAIAIGNVSVVVQPSSLLSDKIRVRSVNMQAPEITFESGLSGNNLNKIMANVEAASASSTTPPTAPGGQKTPKAEKKIQVDDLVIAGGKIHLNIALMGGKSATVPLPEIHLTDLGAGTGGLTGAELAQKILKAITDGAVKAAGGAVTGLGKGVTDSAQSVGKGAAEGVEKATKSITDIFKKK